MVAVPAAGIPPVAEDIRHIGPTAAAVADVLDNVAASCAHRHWSYGRGGCPCGRGQDHVSWMSGTNVVLSLIHI